MRRLKERTYMSSSDIKIEAQYYLHYLDKAMVCLSENERRAVHLRFMKPRTIAQVASRMNMTWDEADRLIDTAVSKVRENFRQSLRMGPTLPAA